ncbi:meprin A subunit beta-like isoform X3 [Oreochromis niloticus]|uniref:meprin A subunit beta-like isoform X3 n=1 Tax=Oreochromis niloticus TaxID=8128 RepID=UPI000905784E|nr:meprin A subunit beta-like isoform X3 [Oreochromis niloticus]
MRKRQCGTRFHQRHTMRMKGCVFLFVSMAISEAFSLNPTGPDIVDVAEEKDIPEINKEFLNDDILEPTNMQKSTIIDENILWKSPVPYVLNNDLDINSKGVILRAFDQFRLKSCIDFKPRDSEDDYISVKQLDGCWSYIGQVISNGQELSIGRGCGSIAIVEHEFLHALGFYHEQSRYDRNDYVTIQFENILEDKKNNFRIVGSNESTTHGVPYDYLSVMHYAKDAFTNGNGSTIITKDPNFQNLIGQRLEMSASDVQELNLLYKCNTSIAFKMYCGFTNGTMCQMNRCSKSGNGWEMVTGVYGGPSSDHTNLPNGNGNQGQDAGYFMYASTESVQEGDSAWLETKRMSPQRECHVQCLQFYYYHNGSKSDELNIWIREFQDERDSTGTLYLMGQITGPPTSHWTLHHVPLNATKQFQVEFEVRKGAGNSTGGFSIDDINLSELECPDGTWQINNFERLLNTTDTPALIYSPRQYSSEGYAYRVALNPRQTDFGVYVQLVSGVYDDQLKWPCPQRQFTVQMVDQNPNIQLQMSRQISITTDPNLLYNGVLIWGKPREVGSQIVDKNNEIIYVNTLYGYKNFASLEDIQSRDYLKGESAIFIFNLQDLTPLLNGSSLPCPQVKSVSITSAPTDQDKGPCSSRTSPTTLPSLNTTDDRISSITIPTPEITNHNRTSPTTLPSLNTTDDRISSTTIPTPEITNHNRTSPTAIPILNTTDDRTSPTTLPSLNTTDDRISSTTIPTPEITNHNRTSPTAIPILNTTDDRTSPTTLPSLNTTDDRISSTTIPTPEITNHNRTSPTAIPILNTTDDRTSPTTLPSLNTTYDRISSTTIPTPEITNHNRTSPTTLPSLNTTYDRTSPTTIPTPETTDDSIFCFSPGMVASPVLTLLLALMLLIP